MSLTQQERKLLRAIADNPYASQREYAEKIGLSRSATANLLSKLQDEGYILGKPYLLNDFVSAACIGGANIDRKVLLKEAPVVGTSNPVTEKMTFGGVVRNIAENLAYLGVATTLISIVGNDVSGDSLLQHASGRIDTTAVSRTDQYATGTYSALLEPNGNMYIGLAAMEICNLMNAAWIRAKQKYLMRSEWLICDCNVMPDGLAALIDLALDKDKKLAIIGVSAPKMRHLPKRLKRVSLGIFNVDESQAYFKSDQTDPVALAKLWLAAGFQQIVVTAGAEPFAYGQQGVVKTGAVCKTERVSDVTGAGDAFSGGLLYGLIRGHSLERAVEMAALNAALNIQSHDSVRSDLTETLLLTKRTERGV